MANRVCSIYEEQGVVCPTQLRGGLFTVGSVDNIDHNPSSTTARDSFHGTAISLVQQPCEINNGVDQVNTTCFEALSTSQSKISPLPKTYTSVPYFEIETDGRNQVPPKTSLTNNDYDGLQLTADDHEPEFRYVLLE